MNESILPIARVRDYMALMVLLMGAAPARTEESATFPGATVGIQNAAETDWAISTAGKSNSVNAKYKICAYHTQPICGADAGGGGATGPL